MAIIIINLCKHLGLDYFVINDFDFEKNFITKINEFKTKQEYVKSCVYLKCIKEIEVKNSKGDELSEQSKKAVMTNNCSLIKEDR